MNTATHATFRLDLEDKVFTGVHFNESWNGFACPYFTEETYTAVVEYLNEICREDGEDLYFPEVVLPSPLLVDGTPFYSIGYGFTWVIASREVSR